MRCNRKKLAAILGHDVKTIDKMVADGMPYVRRPDKKQGETEWQFDTAAVLGWLLRGTTAAQMKRAKFKLAEANAGIKWLEYGEALGHLQKLCAECSKRSSGRARAAQPALERSRLT